MGCGQLQRVSLGLPAKKGTACGLVHFICSSDLGRDGWINLYSLGPSWELTGPVLSHSGFRRQLKSPLHNKGLDAWKVGGWGSLLCAGE